MKSFQHTTSASCEPTMSTIGTWSMRLHLLHQQLAPHFARPETHQHALRYLQAVISDVPRKNGWQIAEQAQYDRPYGIQRLLARAVWEHDGVRDDLRSFVCQTLKPPAGKQTAPFPVLVLDESGFPKRGRHSAGVAHQYCGCTGHVENCQVGVFASYVTALGHALIDRELYLPEDWCSDLPRRQAAHVPDHVRFATKPELALRMVERAQAAQLLFRWVVADTVYGHCTALRLWLEAHGYSYGLAVPSTETVSVQTRIGLLLSDVATIARQALRARDWHRHSQSLGTKGERLFDWACLPIALAGEVDGRHFLLVRRCLDASAPLAYFFVWAPPATPLSLMVEALGARWHIEEDLHACKALGLDHHEGRSFHGWYRHITLVLLAHAFLLSLALHPYLSTPPPPTEPVDGPALIALTTAEVRHLLAHLCFPPSTSPPLICHWSLFRRTHQFWASFHHRRRRVTASLIS